MIIVKDFKWTQSGDQIVIEVPLKNVASSADILTNEKFIKIHAAPFYFEVFLRYAIIEDESRCKLTKNEAIFHLKKAEPVEWDQLERDFTSKEKKARVKCEILEKVQEDSKAKLKTKLEQKEKIKRAEVENAIAKDAETRETIEKIQKLAIEHEMSKVRQSKEDQKKAIEPAKIKVEQKPQFEAPAIRKSGTIEVKFSERNFITPKRESQDPAEQEWLMKQAEARKSIGFVAEDLRPEERDPMYLKEKGDEFFRQKNYLAAISAYTTGIKLASKCYELYLNRSAAHFLQENYQRCAEDCTKALELLNPPVESNRKARIQALTRRGAALNNLGFLKQAYEEFVAAIKLDPSDKVLAQDADMLRAKLEAYHDE